MNDFNFYVELIRRRYEDNVITDAHELWEAGHDTLLDFPELSDGDKSDIVRETIDQYLSDLQ